jgi:anti-sigma B factor antagonist
VASRAFELEFRVRKARLASGAFYVSVTGELDAATAPQLASALLGLDGYHASELIVDLTDVTLLDSIALRVLVREARRRRESGGDVTLVIDDRSTVRLLQATGALPLFRVERTLNNAVRAAAGA